MNNQIALRTSKGEYLPGDIVYGAVYLQICCPSEARGASVTFKGKETCLYECLVDGPRTQFRNEKLHVNFSGIHLYSQDGCLPLGCYVFPFKFELPKEIPGTFQFKRQQGPDSAEWRVDISYLIQAYAIGAVGLQASQLIVINQAQPEELKVNYLGTAEDVEFSLPGFLPFFSKSVHITVKLLQNFTETGSNLQLRLIVSNPSKHKVTGFKIKLVRYLKFMFQDQELVKEGVKNVESVDDLVLVAPEGGPHIVHSISGMSEAIFEGTGGLDRIQFPLTEKVFETRENLPPSVIGKHVKNQYGLEVAVTFNNTHTPSLNLTVPGILPKANKEWADWTAPAWSYHCEIKSSSSCIFCVPESNWYTEALSNLPTFQVL